MMARLGCWTACGKDVYEKYGYGNLYSYIYLALIGEPHTHEQEKVMTSGTVP